MNGPDIENAENIKEQDALLDVTEASPGTKLERRRRIEDILEEKQLKREMGEFELG